MQLNSDCFHLTLQGYFLKMHCEAFKSKRVEERLEKKNVAATFCWPVSPFILCVMINYSYEGPAKHFLNRHVALNLIGG